MAESTMQSKRYSSDDYASRTETIIRWDRIFTYLVLGFGTLLALLPFVWMFNWSFMAPFEVGTGQFVPSKLLPANIAQATAEAEAAGIENYNVWTEYVFANYLEAWFEGDLGRYMWNSIRIIAIQLTGLFVVCVPAAYAFARMQFFGKNFLFTLMLTTLMIPGVVTLIPNYLTVIWLSRLSEGVFGPAGAWINSWQALTIPFMASAFTIFLLRQFFAQIPKDLWDAAQIDGSGHLGFMVRIVLPLSRAPLFTVALFTFVGTWNGLIWPLLVNRAEEWKPIAQGLQAFVQTDSPNAAHLQMAAAVITVLPIIILYFFAQKQFTEGLWSGAVK